MPEIAPFSERRASPDDIEIVFKLQSKQDGEVPFSIFLSNQTFRNRNKAVEILGNVLACGICCGQKSGTAACMVRCVYGDGQCCDSGVSNCSQVGD